MFDTQFHSFNNNNNNNNNNNARCHSQSEEYKCGPTYCDSNIL
jgi:hypothetical protein